MFPHLAVLSVLVAGSFSLTCNVCTDYEKISGDQAVLDEHYTNVSEALSIAGQPQCQFPILNQTITALCPASVTQCHIIALTISEPDECKYQVIIRGCEVMWMGDAVLKCEGMGASTGDKMEECTKSLCAGDNCNSAAASLGFTLTLVLGLLALLQ